MSIQREYGMEVLRCDICGNPDEGIKFDIWEEALSYKKENGWKTKKEGGGWIDICPDCQE